MYLSIIFIKNVVFRPLGSTVTPLPFDHELPGSIPALPWDFSLMEEYSTVCTDWVFLNPISFIHVLSCVVFEGDSADQRSEDGFTRMNFIVFAIN